MAHSMRVLYQEGGIARFYRGLSFALLQNPLSRFGLTAANEAAMVLVEALPWLSVSHATSLASLGAGLWRITIAPLDTCKTVLQIEGVEGFRRLRDKVQAGNIACLYQGAFAASVATIVGYYPWFMTFTLLDTNLEIPEGWMDKLLRSAAIGFAASAVSDLCSNSLRVLKATKQSVAMNATSLSYREAIHLITKEDGLTGLLGRGLGTRILTNGIQSMLFSVVWKALREEYVVGHSS
ncbi:unnamed protein product [Chrysoparadoxa australica]